MTCGRQGTELKPRRCWGGCSTQGFSPSPSHLVDVLAEGGHGDELADEVQVSCSEGKKRAAVVRRQVVFVDLGDLLQQRETENHETGTGKVPGGSPPTSQHQRPANISAFGAEAGTLIRINPCKCRADPTAAEETGEEFASPLLRDPSSKINPPPKGSFSSSTASSQA